MVWLLLLLLTAVEARVEDSHAVFQRQGEVVIGNEYCHVLLDLDLNNVTEEIAEISHAAETIVKLVKEDDLKPYLA